MRRMPARTLTPARLAKELAAIARQLGDGPAAATAVFGQFVAGGDERLRAAAERLPNDALRQVDELSTLARRDELFAHIDQQHQPVLPGGYLLELFLRELDGPGRHRRGVYFTPRPLVQFIVRAVCGLIEEHFRDQPLHVIDPACGYGAFLWEALQPARPLRAAKSSGFELCPVTCAIAQLLLGQAANPQSQIPTLRNLNPLTAGDALSDTILGPPEQPFVPVIVGNPPWSNFGRQNGSPWMAELLSDYRAGLAERKSNLTDDAIKFIRWGQHWIDRAGRGILAFVTPSTWLAGLTHRQMRESLLRSFDKLLVVDLHGESGGDGGDENVFGVRSGVAIVVLVKLGSTARTESSVLGAQYSVPSMQQDATRVRHLDLTGTRSSKFNALARCANSASLGIVVQPTPPHWLISPRDDRPERRARWTVNYETFWPLDRIFHHYISGVQTKNDTVFVAFTGEQLAEQVQQFLAAQVSPIKFDPHFVQPYLVAPFDRRYVYFDPRLIGRARDSVMRHMLWPNVGLVFMRQSTGRGDYDHFLAVDCLVSDRVFYSRHGAPFLAPLWVREEGSGLGVQSSEPDTNLQTEFTTSIAEAIQESAASLEIFHFLYGIAHSQAYRRQFASELRRGFPRFPLPGDRDSFRELCKLGEELVELHLGKQTPEAGLPPAENDCDDFRLGGYDVLRRWQAPRAKRGLTPDDERELDRLAWIGRETRRLAVEIDADSRDHWSRPGT